MPNCFDAITAQLTGAGPAPKVTPSRPADSPTSLSIARYEVLGVSAGSGVLGYVEWQELSEVLREGEQVLDEIVSEREGRPTSSVVWAGRAAMEDVVAVLEAAAATHLDLVVPADPPTRRAWVDGKSLSSYKRRNVLIGALDAAAVASEESLVVTARSVAEDLHAVDDWTLLAALDEVAAGAEHAVLREQAAKVKALWDVNGRQGSDWSHMRLGHLLTHLVEEADGRPTDAAIAEAARRLFPSEEKAG